ncbi:DUF397 domain-containing protein [Streptomyces lycii]|uniref:DUF397 domain-containing protein n=1 Tax=Streptomyces lycii TaxID=2654337 RepID=A0ABQ7FPA4_9ACTN|nr:DUF397 domain-containing protein [Streptomyces lycii]KAF4410761.1 DUF397 domain-containing protein [Streptomyces lycii]
MGNALDLDSANWRKSSYSGDTGGDCIEAAALGSARWRKSSHSGDTGGQCVEVADVDGIVAVRDSKSPDGPALTLSPAAFAAFVRGAISDA